MTEDTKSLDVLGAKPLAEAALHVTRVSADGAASFLSKICSPAASEFGLLLQDKVREWRARNAIRVLEHAQEKYCKYGSTDTRFAHPRLVSTALEYGSWYEQESLQRAWGGLLAASCTPDGKDDSNLIYMTLLSQLTALQVQVLNYSIERSSFQQLQHGIVVPANQLILEIPEICNLTNCQDVQRLDAELDHMRSLQLIVGGISFPGAVVDITPYALSVALYVRAQGFAGTPAEYFGLSPNEAT